MSTVIMESIVIIDVGCRVPGRDAEVGVRA